MRSSRLRFTILILVIPIAWWLFLQVRSSWRNYWLLVDGQQGIATVTKEYWGGHGQVVYSYVVNETHYTGVSSKDWKDKKYRKLHVGEDAIVYFSASHPWLSLLYKPDGYFNVLPALIALSLGVLVLVTALKPNSNWALNLEDRKEPTPPDSR